jgi:hypothetical protein
MSGIPQDVVSLYLRAQNLEQMRRIDEAVVLYEQAVTANFDSAGPYDRLIAIYLGREQHGDVIRVAAAALDNVRTFPDKRAWYESIKQRSAEAVENQSGHGADRRGAEF